MLRRTLLVLAALGAAPVRAQDAPAAPAPAAWVRADVAAEAAHADCGGLAAVDRPWQRYVWLPDRDQDAAAALAYAANLAAGRGRVLHTPAVLGDGLLLRFDLRLLAPEPADLAGLVDTWEALATSEPYFHATRVVVTKVAPYVAADGQTYDFRSRRIREFALHAGPNALLSLKAFTGSDAPIVEGRFLLTRMLSTLDGGLYYRLRGIEAQPAQGTALAAFLRSLGADEKALSSADPKNKAAVFFSKVTGKPRAVAFFFGRNTRPSDAPPLVTVTLDVADGDVDPDQHPIYTLIGAKFRAAETIGILPNGLPVYALFNAAGALQDSVPDNIAADHTVPAPHTHRLQPAIGCIRCHGPHEGWQPVVNDVADLLAAGLAPLADRTEPDAARAWDRVLGEYTGDLEEPLRQARNGHERAVHELTGGVWAERSALTAAAQVARLWAEYQYELVTPDVACLELGEVVVGVQAGRRRFEDMVPRLPSIDGAVQLEDPTIAALRAGKGVLRFNWEHVYADCALRSAKELNR